MPRTSLCHGTAAPTSRTGATAEPSRQPSGKEWQKAASISLLFTHCPLRGEVYQEIPDQTHGDGGLEGISTGGDAYQCYSDEKTLSPDQLTKKQKDKIRKDIWKLEENLDFWTDFLQGTKIKRWFLVVPMIANKDVVTYARREAAKLRKKNWRFWILHSKHLSSQRIRSRRRESSLSKWGVLSIGYSTGRCGCDSTNETRREQSEVH